jgi:hypothetical protein
VPPPPKPTGQWKLVLLALLALLLLAFFAPCWLVEMLPLPRAVAEFLSGETSYWPLPGHGWSTAHAPPLHRAPPYQERPTQTATPTAALLPVRLFSS